MPLCVYLLRLGDILHVIVDAIATFACHQKLYIVK